MEILKRPKQANSLFLLVLTLLAVAGISGAIFVFRPEHFNLTVESGAKFAMFNLGAALSVLIAVIGYFAGSLIRRQRETDARLRGLAKYVEELRAFTVPRLDTVLEALDLYERPELENQSQSAPPAVEVPTEPVIEAPLGTRERDTLLTIIAALARSAKIDLKTPGKSAIYIEGLTVELGARVSKRAIEEHLKKIPNALETRMK